MFLVSKPIDKHQDLMYNIITVKQERLITMKTITTIEELMNTLEGSGYFGLRKATEHDLEVIGRGYLDCSYDWFDGEQSEKKLNGSCAISINDCLDEKEIMERYNRVCDSYINYNHTDTVLLLNDKNEEYGNDPDEVILGSNGYGADVVAIVKL